MRKGVQIKRPYWGGITDDGANQILAREQCAHRPPPKIMSPVEIYIVLFSNWDTESHTHSDCRFGEIPLHPLML